MGRRSSELSHTTPDNPTPSHELRTHGILPIVELRSPRPRGEVTGSGSPASKRQSRERAESPGWPKGPREPTAQTCCWRVRSGEGETHAQDITEEKQSLFQTDKTHTEREELLSLGRCCKSLFLVPEGQGGASVPSGGRGPLFLLSGTIVIFYVEFNGNCMKKERRKKNTQKNTTFQMLAVHLIPS